MAKSVYIKNLSHVKAALYKRGEKFTNDLKKEVFIRAKVIANDATRLKGVSSIQINTVQEDNGLTQLIQASSFANAPIAAYINFGTGTFAAQYLAGLPADIQELARQYYVNGQGRLPANPYLTNPYLRERKKFTENLKKIVKRYSSKSI
jgi:hypothetical protein